MVSTDRLQITREKSDADFRAELNLTEAGTAGLRVATLTIPHIDDEGTIKVNGTTVGSHVNWHAPFVADIARFLKSGKNIIEVHVRNRGGAGGLGGAATVVTESVPAGPLWRRTTFNGYCQVIVAAPKHPGEFTLTLESAGLKPVGLQLKAE